MAKIYKIKQTGLEAGLENTAGVTGKLIQYVTEDIPNPTFKHLLNITSNELKYKFIRTSDEKILYNFSIQLDQIKSSALCDSQSFVIPSDISINGSSGSETEIQLITQDLVFPLPSASFNKNRSLVINADSSNIYFSPLRIFIPNKNGDFTTFEYSVYNEVNGFEIDVEVNSPNTVSTELRGWRNFFSTITTTTQQSVVTAGDTIIVNVSSSDNTLDMVFLEPITGIVDRTRVKLTNGVGSFNILTSSLQAADVAEVKVNFKQFTGVARFTKTIS